MAKDSIPPGLQKARKEAYDAKWADLERRGFKKPKDEAERQKRLREARDGQ